MKEGTNSQIKTISFRDEKYPDLLRQMPDPPTKLYYRGNLDILKQPTLAVVGSRKYSQTGKISCQQIVGPLAKKGAVIVSGLAIGIDAIAHETALANQGLTVAVLGTGLNDNVFYPKQNKKLAQMILERGGLILSEYPPDYEANKQSFPKRNRIVAGLSLGVLIVEADIRSGSLITARCALDYNRDVFAIPYSINHDKQGTNELIKRGAYLINSSDDIWQTINLRG